MSAIKQIMADPSLGYYYAQKGVRVMPLRRVLGAAVAGVMGLRNGALGPPGNPAVTRRLANELAETGFSSLPEKALGQDRIAAIRDELAVRPLYDYYGSKGTYDLQAIPSGLLKARHDSADVLACRGLMDLANDSDILSAVSERLGAAPTLASVEAWWTFGENNETGQQAFDDIYHRDADDLRFVKLFVYLTDTGRKGGAHRFVLGSHADGNFVRRGPISEADVESAYPPERMLTVTGGAGTCFLEETWGIHRAMLATEGRRLMFSAIYALAAHMPFAPRRPLLPLPDGYNRYVNRLLFY